ncbi:MAG: hypothetical protein WBH56_00050, partial [Bacteroidota bacterium]
SCAMSVDDVSAMGFSPGCGCRVVEFKMNQASGTETSPNLEGQILNVKNKARFLATGDGMEVS